MNHAFLRGRYEDGYFPDHVVDKGKAILLQCDGRTSAPADLPHAPRARTTTCRTRANEREAARRREA
ncbi:DUF5713 family protein [Nonomuraea sp. 3N208]|uniref:DUF5713 family protein n=1 Tax=Nonomuraea sp. 3N208 TaxID=3457421 RepID=UPI003FCFA011